MALPGSPQRATEKIASSVHLWRGQNFIPAMHNKLTYTGIMTDTAFVAWLKSLGNLTLSS